ncbi:hypothetical protein [Pedobacter sp. R-06]|uniref:hypothetical protein n=1 Tax=Pedobacter sp. R-06 TaxID=3404051 RepID=UPI003CEC0888
MKINIKIKRSPLAKSTAFSLLICLVTDLFAQIRQDTLRLFIIGNSFSQNASTFLPQMAKERGKPLLSAMPNLPEKSSKQSSDESAGWAVRI